MLLLALWTFAPLTFISGSPLPTFTVSKYSTYRQCVSVRMWGVLSPVGDHILEDWPASKPTKLLDHPKQKPRRGGGLRQINTCRKVPLQLNFFRWRHFALLSISLIFLRAMPTTAKNICRLYFFLLHAESFPSLPDPLLSWTVSLLAVSGGLPLREGEQSSALSTRQESLSKVRESCFCIFTLIICIVFN